VTTLADSSLIQSLTGDLAASGQLPDGAHWQRLRGGRTNHVWQVTGPKGGDPIVVKLYDGSAQNPLFPNRPKDEARVLGALEGQGVAPRLLHHATTRLGPCLIYSHLDGAPWRDDPATAAKLLYRVHHMAPPKGLRRPPDGSAAIARQIMTILAAAGQTLQNLPDLPTVPVTPSRAHCLLHGDPVPGNMIDCGEHLLLIDWQCPGVGDPCEDIALFLSPAMQIAYRGAPLSDVEETAFLAAYGDADTVRRYTRLAPWYHARTLAYCLWQAAQGEDAALTRASAERTALDAAMRAQLQG
jgi:hypothetical protein